jgi:ABC-2 type transport system ATP-binding protein
VLIRCGRIVGDITASELEEQGKTLMSYIKETYNYRADRVSRALDDISGEGSR